MCIKIISALFNLTKEEDKKIIDSQIDFLFSNNKIKKISNTKILTNFVADWVTRKVL